MTNIKATKRALGSSVLALFLCFAMLLGTTFAWFTDSVTSANNIITAGNLDVELEYAKVENGALTAWDTVGGKDNVFDKNALWEPGRVEVVYLKVSNLGTLDLKYQLGVNVYSETPGVNVDNEIFKLSEHLVFKVVEMPDAITTYTDREAVAVAAGTEMGLKDYNGKTTALTAKNGGNDVDYLALIVYMPETVGNEANYRGDAVPQITLGINLFATQYNSEEDSFGSNYDEYAPIVSVPEALPDVGNTTTPVVMTLKGYGDTEEETVSVAITKSVIEKLKDANVTEVALSVSKPVVDTTNNTITFDSIEIVDQNGEIVELSNLELTEKITVTLPAQTQFAAGEKVTVYHDGVAVAIATVDANGVISYDVEHLCEVTVGAADVPATDDGKTYTISTLAQLLYFAQDVNSGNTYEGKTVVLAADIDLGNMEWAPIGTTSNIFKGTFDGNGHVISNLKVTGYNSNVGFFGVTHDGEIKNLTIKNATVSGRLNVGTVAGQPYTTKYTNITVTGHVEVNGMAYVGGVGGKNAYANWTDITVDVDATSYVKANSVENGTAYRTYVGGVVGFNGEGGHTFSNITSNIDVYGSTCDVGGAFGIAHYGNKFENVKVTGNVICDGYEVGGIAGVWHNENGTSVTFTNCTYEGEGKLSFVGSAYSEDGTGKLIVDGFEVVASKAALQAKLDADVTDIELVCDIVGDVIVTQKEGVNVVIDGNGYKYDGTIYIYGQARHDGKETLTIKNINFASDEAKDFISSNSTDSDKRYAHNVTVENCSFTGAEGFGSVGMRYRQAYNMSIVNCTATNLHSLVQATGGKGITVKGVTINGCKNGMSFGTTDNVTVEGSKITSVGDYGYGIRVDASGAYNLVVENCEITADVCVLFRKATGAYAATLTGNTLTARDYTVLATASDYEEGTTLTAATGALNITVDGATAVYDGASLEAALAADKDVIFVSDITMKAEGSNGYGKTGINVKNGQTIDGNGYTLKVTGAGGTWDSAISTTGGIIKNLTVAQGFRGIFVNHNSTYSETVVLDNVTIKGPTYTISCDQGTKQNLVATNCTIKGWTSYAATIGEVKFENCTFGKGAGYNFSRPYASTEYVDCTFEAGHTIDARAAVTFENCTIAGAALTADNLATLVTSNIKNASVK